MSVKLNRTVGLEVEGFVADECIDVRHGELGWDGSLHDGDGDAIEFRTNPLDDLDYIKSIYDDLQSEGLNVNDSCGLHIHVDNRDYTIEDKAKLLRFGAGIELLMFSLVDRSRHSGYHYDDEGSNPYCKKIHHSWRKIFRPSFIEQNIPFDTFDSVGDLGRYVNENSEGTSGCWNGRAQWLNTVTSYPTVEFRIFNAVEDYQTAQQYAMLAHQIVETVKNSTVEQLQFLIKSAYESVTVEDMFTKLFTFIGLDSEYRPSIKNYELANYLETKFCQNNRESQVEQEVV